MKRGFFNGERSKREPKPTTESIVPTEPQQSKIKIPSEQIPIMANLPTILENFNYSSRSDPLIVTTLPVYDPSRPDEPTTECLIHQQMKEKILSTPGFPEPVIVPRPKYRIRPIKGVGMGMFATEDIDIGEIIVKERPLLLGTMAVCAPGVEMQPMAVERMSEKDKEEFFALHNCKGYTRSHVRGIIDTNAIGIGGLPGYDAECAAVCKDISRANHSCSPNTTWRWHLEAFAAELRAIWPIKKGEEITVRYESICKPRAERQKFLLERYKFKCTCSACSVSFSARSDNSRALIQSHSTLSPCEDEDQIRDWVRNPKLPDDLIIAQCNTMLRIMDEEKVTGPDLWSVWYQRLVKAYCALEDEENAKLYAEKARKMALAWTRSDCGWAAVAKDTKRTDWWGLRAKTRSGFTIASSFSGVPSLVFPMPSGVDPSAMQSAIREMAAETNSSGLNGADLNMEERLGQLPPALRQIFAKGGMNVINMDRLM